jgi:hypothetical protein
MRIRTCLLISDDPDDHLEFSEALYEVSSDTILVSIVNAHKSLDLLKAKVYLPDFIFFDLSDGVHADVFLTTIQKDPILENVPVIVYGGYPEFEKITTLGVSAFLSDDYSYSDLRSFLKKILEGG